jgi:hypothetical protein
MAYHDSLGDLDAVATSYARELLTTYVIGDSVYTYLDELEIFALARCLDIFHSSYPQIAHELFSADADLRLTRIDRLLCLLAPYLGGLNPLPRRQSSRLKRELNILNALRDMHNQSPLSFH